jgi:DNA mismatch repair ATPase MutL
MHTKIVCVLVLAVGAIFRNTRCRIPLFWYRVRAMLAMRACRSSIMIGKTLDHATMRRILDNLAELKSPWNCPHGRPTMRHLAVLPAEK